MLSPISLQDPAMDLTGDGSLDEHPETVVHRAAHAPARKSPSQPPLNRVPWKHMLILCAITILGIAGERVFLSFINAGMIPQNSVVQFMQLHVCTVTVGFGFAIYGCIVNRRLRLENERRENLGPYKLLKLIGAGGMGEVYLAEHELLKRRCAVKLIRSDKASNRRMLARFEREVKATAQLTHWNTVQVFDYGRTESGTFYYSMEYLQGLNLKQLVEQHGPQDPGRVIFILRQLCGALHEAAIFGLVHRDIKPSNIFLTERGQMFDVAKLLDFGLVRPASFGTCPIQNVSRQLQGSPRFMCPEQAQGQKPDCRGDIYSLACVAYFLLSGRAPFENENPVMLVVAHASAIPPTFDEIGVHVPEDLANIVMRCLKKNPVERFQCPRELQNALDKCINAWDWSWGNAEDWWLDNPKETHHQLGEPGSTQSETTPDDMRSNSEQDATFVSNGRDTNDNSF